MVVPQAVGYRPTGHYGYGLFVWDGGITIGHTGSLPMVRAMVAHQSDGYTWCILVNGTFDDYSTGFRNVMGDAITSTGDVWPAVDYTAAPPVTPGPPRPHGEACTIVAASGHVAGSGRPT